MNQPVYPTPPNATYPPPHRHLAALIIGALLVLPGLGLLLGGAGILIGAAAARDDAGFYSFSLDSLRSPTAAITTEDNVIRNEPDVPTWVLDWLDLDMRVTARPVKADQAIFIGVGPSSAVRSYLAGTAHDQVSDIRMPEGAWWWRSDQAVPSYRTTTGGQSAPAPTEQTFWSAKVSGTGQQQLTWQPSSGSWDAVLMNADGSPGVDVAATVGVRAGFLLPMAAVMMVIGLLLTALAVALIIRGASVQPAHPGYPAGPGAPVGPGAPAGSGPYAAYGASGSVGAPGEPGAVAQTGEWGPPAAAAPAPATHAWALSPVALNARLDEPLSRWLWLVKWFLAIPHFVVLAVLWIAFGVVCVIAFFAILFTGAYPRGLFDFNLGVLRWSWRVEYYCANGGLGTDRYPPFSLDVEPDYPATLDIAYPERLSRGLVLIKWWLLAIPHYLIVALLVGGGWGWTAFGDDRSGYRFDPVGGGILGLLVVIAGVFLLFAGRYPPSLFSLVIGLNRWVYRVIAYASLMTDVYPPFQLDEGGAERQLAGQPAQAAPPPMAPPPTFPPPMEPPPSSPPPPMEPPSEPTR